MVPSAEGEQHCFDSVAEMPQTPADFATAGWKLAAKGCILPQVGDVPVKNTFIDDLPDDLPEEDLPILRATSAPELVGQGQMARDPRDALIKKLQRENADLKKRAGLDTASDNSGTSFEYTPFHIPAAPHSGVDSVGSPLQEVLQCVVPGSP